MIFIAGTTSKDNYIDLIDLYNESTGVCQHYCISLFFPGIHACTGNEGCTDRYDQT